MIWSCCLCVFLSVNIIFQKLLDWLTLNSVHRHFGSRPPLGLNFTPAGQMGLKILLLKVIIKTYAKPKTHLAFVFAQMSSQSILVSKTYVTFLAFFSRMNSRVFVHYTFGGEQFATHITNVLFDFMLNCFSVCIQSGKAFSNMCLDVEFEGSRWS